MPDPAPEVSRLDQVLLSREVLDHQNMLDSGLPPEAAAAVLDAPTPVMAEALQQLDVAYGGARAYLGTRDPAPPPRRVASPREEQEGSNRARTADRDVRLATVGEPHALVI